MIHTNTILNMRKRIALLFAITLVAPCLHAMVPQNFFVPDIPGYVTLTGDFHVHTCFSDGAVWPTTRVAEAAYDDLDFLAMTDHVDSRHQKMKKKGYFTEKVDQNTSYKFAKSVSGKYGVTVLHGAEISRGLRLVPAHFNTHFISDAMPILESLESEDAKIEDPMTREEVAVINGLKAARAQNAFITFNHPNWHPQQPVKTEWMALHEKVYQLGLIDGIEIVNSYLGLCPEAFHWAIEKGLTVVSGTDCHDPMFELYDYQVGEKRPRTLVFAKENTPQSIKEAVLAGRTIVYHDDCFYGAETTVRPFFNEALKVLSVEATSGIIRIKVKNTTSAPVILSKDAGSDMLSVQFYTKINPGEETVLEAAPIKGAKLFDFKECDLNYKVLNYFVDTDTPLKLSWHFSIPTK